LALSLRNDEVQRLAERFGFGKTEDALGRLIPQRDSALRIANHDRVAGSGNELGEIDVRLQR
jgi:hypothetical protein